MRSHIPRQKDVLHKTALLTTQLSFIRSQSTVCPVLWRRKALAGLTLVSAVTQLAGMSLQASPDTAAAYGKV